MKHNAAIGVFLQALNIFKNGGEDLKYHILITYQEPVPVRFEKGFEGIYPVFRVRNHWSSESEGNNFIREFEGSGFVIGGRVPSESGE